MTTSTLPNYVPTIIKYYPDWTLPDFAVPLWQARQHPWCVVIPVINEGQRIAGLLQRLKQHQIHQQADIIIVDGGSTDGSLELPYLTSMHVSSLLLKTGPGRLSAQLRCAYAFALYHGYDGIITIDGNNKDDPEAIPRFIEAMHNGIDFVQASRFITGGEAQNTPPLRDFAIRYLHAPLLSLASGFHWTDTTQGFRAYRRDLLLDPAVAPFREVFEGYELLAYLSQRAPRLGYRCTEVATRRCYPDDGEIPTKISHIHGNFELFKVLIRASCNAYAPTSA